MLGNSEKSSSFMGKKAKQHWLLVSSDPTGSAKLQHRNGSNYLLLREPQKTSSQFITANTKTRGEPLVSREKHFSTTLSKRFIQLCGTELIWDGPTQSGKVSFGLCLWKPWRLCSSGWEGTVQIVTSVDFKSQRLQWYWLLLSVPHGQGIVHMCNGTTNTERIRQVLEQQTLPCTLMRNVPDYSSTRMPNRILPALRQRWRFLQWPACSPNL